MHACLSRVGSKDALLALALQQLRGFNRQECAATFQRLLNVPLSNRERAFAHWGIAYCNGADYNMYGDVYAMLRQTDEWPSRTVGLANASMAVSQHAPATDPWSVVYAATKLRFVDPSPHAYVKHLEDHLGDRELADPILYAVRAEARMLLEPWKLWNGRVSTPNARRVFAILQDGLSRFPNDAWLCHLKVHACEMGPTSQFDLAAASALESSTNGHLRHMPSHLYVQLGMYAKSKRLNVEACDLDRRDRAVARSDLSLYSFYECHNIHFVLFSACMECDRRTAVAYARRLTRFVHDRIKEGNPITFALGEAFLMMEPMTYVRFGMWAHLVDMPDGDGRSEESNTYAAFVAYGKAIAHAALGDPDRASEHHRRMQRLAKRMDFGKVLHNEKVATLLDLADAVCHAEILYRTGSFKWRAHLDRAVRLEDSLAYDEPPAWMIPVRQTYGALLIDSGDAAAAVPHLERDLQKWPKNAWSSAALRSAGYAGPCAHLLDGGDKGIRNACACATRSFA